MREGEICPQTLLLLLFMAKRMLREWETSVWLLRSLKSFSEESDLGKHLEGGEPGEGVVAE